MLNTSDLQAELAALLPQDQFSLLVGEYTFRHNQNQALLLNVLENYARKNTGIPTYQQFRNYFEPNLQTPKPGKPTRDDPRYTDPTRKAMYSTQKYAAYQEWRYQKDVTSYHARLQRHETEQTRLQLIRQTYRNEPRGYIKHCMDALSAHDKSNPATAFFFESKKLRINEEARKRHTYITGGSGSGKSELIKVLIHYYLTENKSTSLVLLEPEGDLSRQVAQFKENADSDRLVYIDPLLDRHFTPVVNPFVLPSQSDEYIIDKVSQEVYSIFREILKDGNFTPQMETLLKPCITTLLLMGDCDITDLQKFMDDDRNKAYVDFAIKHLFNQSQRDFMQYDFHKDTYNPTKQSIKTKIQNLLNSYAFSRVMTGKQSFDLEKLLAQRKVVVFNLNEGEMGEDSSDVIGRFLVSQIKAIAFKRSKMEKDKRPRTHVFIDECQRFVTESITTMLTRTRKYGMHLTMANQYYGQGMSQDFKKAISSNTWVKISGSNDNDNLNIFHKATEADLDELKNLGLGEFHIKERKKPSIKATIPDHLIDDKNAMTAQEWEAVKQRMLTRYYHPITPQNTPTADEAPHRPTLTRATQHPAQTIKPKLDFDL